MSFTQIGYTVTGNGELTPVDKKVQEAFSRSMESQIERSNQLPSLKPK
jgi:hypothetical protein